MRNGLAWMALVVAFGASGRILGVDTETYESREELAVVTEIYDAQCD